MRFSVSTTLLIWISIASSIIQTATAQTNEANESIELLRQQVDAAEGRVSDLVTKLRIDGAEHGATSDRRASKEDLQTEVRRLFDLQTKLQLAQLAEAESRIASSRSLIAQRQKRAEKIVSKRVQTLLAIPAVTQSPQVVLDAMERFTAAKDYAGLVGLMTDDEAARMAGMLLQAMSMMNSMMSLVEATQGYVDEADQIKAILAKGQNFMRPNPPSEAVVALQQLASILPSAFYDLGATSQGKPLQRPNLTPKQYARLLRQASGVLTDTRAYNAAMMQAASAMEAESGAKPIPSQWKIEVDGTMAVATQLAQPLERTVNKTAGVHLQLEDGLWKISQLGSNEEMMKALAGVSVAEGPSPSPTTAMATPPAAQYAPSPYAPTASAASTIKERIQGRWIVESLISGNEDGMSEMQGTLELHIQGNIMHQMLGTESVNGPILIAECKGLSSMPTDADGPLPIDLTHDPNGDAETFQGIIACDGETLSICMAIETVTAGMDFRPRLFVPGSKVSLWKCRRASDSPAKTEADIENANRKSDQEKP